MSSFDDRVQRAIAAAIRDHLQYHLDDQQIEQIVNNIDVHVDCPCQSQQPDDCCDIVLDLLQKIIKILKPIDNLRRALESAEEEDTKPSVPETVNPEGTNTEPFPETSKPQDVPTLPEPQSDGWYFDEWIRDLFLQWFGPRTPNGAPAMPAIPAPVPTVPALPLSYGGVTRDQFDLNMSVLSQHISRIEGKLDRMMQAMDECCRTINSKLDRLLPPTPEPVPPEAPAEEEEIPEDIGELATVIREEYPELEVTNTIVTTTPCNDVTNALRDLYPDELLAFLLHSDLYDFDVCVKCTSISGKVLSTSKFMDSVEVYDIYAHLDNGQYVFDELVSRVVDAYVTQYKSATFEDTKTLTYVHYWPKNPQCGEGYTNVYVDTGFIPISTEEQEAVSMKDTSKLVVFDTGTGTSVETAISVAKTDSRAADVAPPIVVSTDGEEITSQGGLSHSGPIGVTMGTINQPRKRNFTTADHDPTNKPLIDGSDDWHQNVRVEVSPHGDSGGNQQSFMIWSAGATYKTPPVVTGLTVGSTLTAEQLHALGYRGANDDKPVVVTNITTGEWSGSNAYDGEHHRQEFATLTVSTPPAPSSDSSVITNSANIKQAFKEALNKFKSRRNND